MPLIATALAQSSYPAASISTNVFCSHATLCPRGIAFEREPRASRAAYHALQTMDSISVTAACHFTYDLSGVHSALQLLHDALAIRTCFRNKQEDMEERLLELKSVGTQKCRELEVYEYDARCP